MEQYVLIRNNIFSCGKIFSAAVKPKISFLGVGLRQNSWKASKIPVLFHADDYLDVRLCPHHLRLQA
jgi:hypothetical protein